MTVDNIPLPFYLLFTMAIYKRPSRTTLTAHALREIKRALLSQKLKPGDRIIETELAAVMNISRFPIREALRILEKEGLVVKTPFKGTHVSDFDDRDREELYTLRSALEELAVRILVEKIDSGKIAKLESILKSMERASRMKDLKKLISDDLRFHRTICKLSNHRKLFRVWLTIEDQLRSFIALGSLYEGFDQAVKTHYPIMEAIKGGDSSFAEKAIRNHLIEALRLFPTHTAKARKS